MPSQADATRNALGRCASDQGVRESVSTTSASTTAPIGAHVVDARGQRGAKQKRSLHPYSSTGSFLNRQTGPSRPDGTNRSSFVK